MACATRSGTSVFSEKGRREMAEFDLNNQSNNEPYQVPKNDFEVQINKHHKQQSLDNYRLKLLKDGFSSKAAVKNGRATLIIKQIKD